MILSSDETIKKYTELGIYSEKTLLDHFKSHVETDPDRVCIVDPPDKYALTGYHPDRITYKELDTYVDAVSSSLTGMGIEKDDIIMVQMPNCWELAMLYLAIAKTGAIISPAPVLWREAELGHIAELTQARMFITVVEFNGFNHYDMGTHLQKKYPTIESVITLKTIKKMCLNTTGGRIPNVSISANDVFSICWTSGTESHSKGCPLSHNNWMGMATLQETAGWKAGDVMMTAGPLVNMASLGTVYGPWLWKGGTLVLHHPFNPQVFMEQIITEKPNYTLLVPAVANMLAKHPDVDSFDLTSFRSITLGSAPPSVWTMDEFKQRWNVEIGNIWGQNEGTGIVSSIEDVPDMEKRSKSFPHYGKAGVKWNSKAGNIIEAKIVGPDGKELTNPGEIGEMVFRGPGLFPGYFKNDEATKRSFDDDGFFRTGDLFKIEEDNLISFYERAKDIIIRGGYNISSQEVENYLLQHPGIQDAAVVGMPDEKLGERMCAYIVTKTDDTVELKDLAELLEAKGVARYKHPERIETIDLIPRNPVGKILKKELRNDIQAKLSL